MAPTVQCLQIQSRPCINEVYVGKNEYGLGKVDVKDKVFYLPGKAPEYWYKTYQVLTFNKDIYTEDISDVKYKTDGVKIIEYPPEILDKSTITNHESQSVTGTTTPLKDKPSGAQMGHQLFHHTGRQDYYHCWNPRNFLLWYRV